MQHTGVVKRLFMEVRPPAVAAVRNGQQERMAPTPRMEWGFYDFLGDSSKFEVSSVKQKRPGVRDCGLKGAGRGRMAEAKCAERTQFPAGPSGTRPRRRGPIMQNEPNFGQPVGVPRRIARDEPNLAPPQAGDGGNCAKQSQTWGDWGMWTKAVVVWGVARPGSPRLWIGGGRLWAGAGGQMRKTNPIGGPGAQDCGLEEVSGGDGQPTKRRSVENEPNLARAPGNGRGLAGRDVPAAGDCAKQSQFLPATGAWRKKSCKNEPNLARLRADGGG